MKLLNLNMQFETEGIEADLSNDILHDNLIKPRILNFLFLTHAWLLFFLFSLTQVAEEKISNMRTVRFFGQERNEMKRCVVMSDVVVGWYEIAVVVGWHEIAVVVGWHEIAVVVGWHEIAVVVGWHEIAVVVGWHEIAVVVGWHEIAVVVGWHEIAVVVGWHEIAVVVGWHEIAVSSMLLVLLPW